MHMKNERFKEETELIRMYHDHPYIRLGFIEDMGMSLCFYYFTSCFWGEKSAFLNSINHVLVKTKQTGVVKHNVNLKTHEKMIRSENLSRSWPGEYDKAFAEADNRELRGEGYIRRKEEQDLVKLLSFVLASPQVKHTKFKAFSIRAAHGRHSHSF